MSYTDAFTILPQCQLFIISGHAQDHGILADACLWVIHCTCSACNVSSQYLYTTCGSNTLPASALYPLKELSPHCTDCSHYTALCRWYQSRLRASFRCDVCMCVFRKKISKVCWRHHIIYIALVAFMNHACTRKYMWVYQLYC